MHAEDHIGRVPAEKVIFQAGAVLFHDISPGADAWSVHRADSTKVNGADTSSVSPGEAIYPAWVSGGLQVFAGFPLPLPGVISPSLSRAPRFASGPR